MPPTWLTALAWTYMAICAVCVAVILVDVVVRRHRQAMKVMEWVWPVSALYLGPIALWAYLRHGRTYSPAYQREHGLDGNTAPHWMKVAVSTSHCGAGCTLGDIGAEWVVFAAGFALLGRTIFASYALDYVFAFLLGVVFQYFAISQMGSASWGELARRTAQSDFFSLTALEVGLFAWMGLTFFVFFTSPHLEPTSVTFWFMMQVGMVIGFVTSYPANWLLVSRGVKETM